jgi:hypothetical protein
MSCAICEYVLKHAAHFLIRTGDGVLSRLGTQPSRAAGTNGSVLKSITDLLDSERLQDNYSTR